MLGELALTATAPKSAKPPTLGSPPEPPSNTPAPNEVVIPKPTGPAPPSSEPETKIAAAPIPRWINQVHGIVPDVPVEVHITTTEPNRVLADESSSLRYLAR